MADGRNVSVGVIVAYDVMGQILLLKEIRLNEVSVIYPLILRTQLKTRWRWSHDV